MITFVLLGALILTVIFFVLRSQGMQKELSSAKSALKSLQKQTKFSLGSIMLMAKQLQHSYKLKLEALRRHGLRHGDDLLILQFIVDNVLFVVIQCCEHKATLEESLKKAVEGLPIDMAKIQQFIAKQGVDVRVPWSKNTLEGFLVACNNLLADKPKTPEQVSTIAFSEEANESV
ncbi:hypothetical protein [Paraglaciecola sp.]|uniref:hypothetical protein n=1 Tax=Paraglaciecola sp. TaxID=1920173 RepID=UPI0030F3818C